MEIKYNVTGQERKDLVKVISEFTGEKSKYQGMPSAAYSIGDFTVTREGTLIFDESVTSINNRLLSEIEATGFAPDERYKSNDDLFDEPENSAHSENVGLTVKIPKDKVNVDNVKKLILGKKSLIKKALGINEFPILENENEVLFPWFESIEPDIITAYTHFVTALCEMSKKAKRVTVVNHEVENEKYSFRCFLLRLGFIGDEYKVERKILLKNLEGSAAYKVVPEKEELQ